MPDWSAISAPAQIDKPDWSIFSDERKDKPDWSLIQNKLPDKPDWSSISQPRISDISGIPEISANRKQALVERKKIESLYFITPEENVLPKINRGIKPSELRQYTPSPIADVEADRQQARIEKQFFPQKDKKTQIAVLAQGIAKDTGMPFEDVVKDFPSIAREYARSKGLPVDPTAKEFVGVAGRLPLAAGAATALGNPVTAGGFAITIALYGAVSEAENAVVSKLKGVPYKFGAGKSISDLLPNETPRTAKDMVDSLEEIGKMFGAYRTTKGLTEIATKQVITKFNLPQKVTIPAEHIKDIFQTGKKISPENLEIFKELGLTAEQLRNALTLGIDVKIPSSKIVTVADRPWFARYKKVFGITPEVKTVVTRAGEVGRTAAGILPGPESRGMLPASTPEQIKSSAFKAYTGTQAEIMKRSGISDSDITDILDVEGKNFRKTALRIMSLKTTQEREAAVDVEAKIFKDKFDQADNIIVEQIIDDIQAGDEPMSYVSKDAEGFIESFKHVGSGYPKYFRDKGYTREETFTILDKVRAKKPLTDKQQKIYNDLKYGKLNDISKDEGGYADELKRRAGEKGLGEDFVRSRMSSLIKQNRARQSAQEVNIEIPSQEVTLPAKLEQADIVFKKVSAIKQPLLDTIGNDIVKIVGAERYFGTPKSVKSMVDKVTRKEEVTPNYAITSMKGHARGTIVIKNWKQAITVIQRLKENGFVIESTIETPLNIYGYRGITASRPLGGGINGEIQVHTSESLAMKKKMDPLYRETRGMSKETLRSLYKKDKNKFLDYFKKAREERRTLSAYWQSIPEADKVAISESVKGLASTVAPKETSSAGTQALPFKTSGPLDSDILTTRPSNNLAINNASINLPSNKDIPRKGGEVKQPKAGGIVHDLTPAELEQAKKIDPQGVKGVNLNRDITVKDLQGNSKTYKKGESIFIYQDPKTGKAIVKDGSWGVLPNKSVQQVQQAGQAWGDFAPESKGLEEVVKEDNVAIAKKKELEKVSDKAEAIKKDIEEKIGGRVYMSGQPYRYMYKTENGDRLDVPKEYINVLEKADTEISAYHDYVDSLGEDYFTNPDMKTKFSQYTLPGGENYREVLIQAPSVSEQFENDLYKKYGVDNRSDLMAKITPSDRGALITHVINARVGNVKGFKSSHRSEPNVIAHIRMDDRITPDGKKVLFVEEIQSDWAKAGREKGLTGQLPDNLIVEKGRDRLGVGQWFVVDKQTHAGNREWSGHTREDAIAAYSRINKSVPNHPSLKKWQELTLKRVLKEAVDGKYDYISWVSGEQTADRYSLAKQVNSISWKSLTGKTLIDNPENINVTIDTKEHGDIDLVVRKKDGNVVSAGDSNFENKKLDDVVGKDIAKKILEETNGNITNDGLRIGGEWAKTLYDKQIPNILKDLTGGKVENISLPSAKLYNDQDIATLISQGMSRDEAMNKLKTEKEKSIQQAIRITPDVKKMVIGQPMAGGNVPPQPPESPAQEQPAEDPFKKLRRERGFVTSVKEGFPELRVGGQYIPRDTDRLAIKARNLIIDDLKTAEKIAQGIDDKAIATVSELIKYYNRKAAEATLDFEKEYFTSKAAEIANNAAVRLTELGRAVQAASILSRQTLEGQLRFAARTIQKYNEEAEGGKRVRVIRGAQGFFRPGQKILELTKEQLQDITNRWNELQTMPDGEGKAQKFKELQDYISNLVPTPLYDKIVAVWKAGLLTGLKTSGVNIFSNITHAFGAEVTKDIPAVILDGMVSLVSGKRSMVFTTKGLPSGVSQGAIKGWRFLKTGYDPRNSLAKYDFRKVNYGKSVGGKTLQAYVDKVFGLMGAEDQPFYYGAFMRSLNDQARAIAINEKPQNKAALIDNLIKNPTEKMLKYAVGDAEIAVFQNDTALSEAAGHLRKIIGADFIIPFTRTPSAVAMQIINYSPAGAALTIMRNMGKGGFDQREFVKSMGRAITGFLILALGAWLFKQGKIALDRPVGESKQKLWEIQGKIPNSIKIGGRYRQVQFLGPLGNLLLVGAHFQNAYNEEGSLSGAMAKGSSGAIKSFTEQTFVRGINSALASIADPDNRAKSFVNSLVASTVPTIVADTARAFDVYERRSKDMGQRIMSRIPGLRQKLEPQIDILGKPVNAPGIAASMIDFSRSSKASDDPVVKEISRLVESGNKINTTRVGDKTGYKILTDKQNTDLFRKAGDIAYRKLALSIFNQKYIQAADDQKAEYIDKLLNNSKDISRVLAVLEVTKTLSGQRLKEKLAELKKDGLMNREVFDTYLETR